MRSYINRHGRRECARHRRHTAGRCPASASSSDPELERLVVDAFFAAVGDIGARPAEDTQRLQSARDALALAEADLVAYRDDPRILRAIGPERFAEGLHVRNEALKAAERDVDDAAPVFEAGVDATTLRGEWPSLAIQERRRLLRLAIDCLFLRRGAGVPLDTRVRICLRGTAPKLRSLGRGPARLLPPFDW